ncbi:hypothetical protein ANCDUO_25031, partial [Ancylostoma duodenale]
MVNVNAAQDGWVKTATSRVNRASMERQAVDDCLKRCDCADGMHCDPSDGECICPPGKRGAKCDQDCEPGRFGAGCRGICACSNGASCDGVSGACTCTPGWRGK